MEESFINTNKQNLITMKNKNAFKVLTLALFLGAVTGVNAQVKVGDNPTSVNASTVLEVESTNKGILIPRVALTGATDVTTIATPATSLLVYNTATAGSAPNAITPGYYYWDGAAWTRIATGINTDWALTGNAGTASWANYIGTSDAQDFVTKVNNTEAMRVVWDAANNVPRVVVGTTTPATVATASSGSDAAHQLAKLTVAGGDASINDITVGKGGGQVLANTAVGTNALANNTIAGDYNTATGYEALKENTSGGFNVADGSLALMKNTTGERNSGFGLGALILNTTGNFNTGLGGFSLSYNATGSNNSAVGYGTFMSLSTGDNNVAIGRDAGFSQTAGDNNIAIGSYTQLYNQSGSNQLNIGSTIYGSGIGTPSQNVSINTPVPATVAGTSSGSDAIHQKARLTVEDGDAAINYITVGRGGGSILTNTATGYQTLFSNTSGYNNVANGYQALFSNTTGASNVATGYQALFSNTIGHFNVASGYKALFSNTEGNYNIALGLQALSSNTTGGGNLAFGSNSLFSNIDGINNIAIGDASLASNGSGQSNLAIGQGSLSSNTNGNQNIALGQTALASIDGNLNIAIGTEAALNQTAGDNNIAIGKQQNLANLTGSNQLNIGGAIYGTGLTGQVSAPAGNIGIKEPNPTSTFQVKDHWQCQFASLLLLHLI